MGRLSRKLSFGMSLNTVEVQLCQAVGNMKKWDEHKLNDFFIVIKCEKSASPQIESRLLLLRKAYIVRPDRNRLSPLLHKVHKDLFGPLWKVLFPPPPSHNEWWWWNGGMGGDRPITAPLNSGPTYLQKLFVSLARDKVDKRLPEDLSHNLVI